MNNEGKNERDRILDRIRKMLAIANGGANVNEAATAAAMAERLMRKYQIDQADVIVEELTADSVEAETVANGTKTMPAWVGWIAFGVAKANECEVTRARDDRGRAVHRFYGVAGDAEVAGEMMRYLIGEVHRLAKAYGGTRAETGSFRRGCGSALQKRLTAMAEDRRQDFTGTAAGTSLVLRKRDLIHRGRSFKYGSAGRRREIDHGYMAGRRAGEGVSLRGQIRSQSANGRLTKS